MMEYKGYLAQVDYDDETGAFHGEVVNLRDVITFEGDVRLWRFAHRRPAPPVRTRGWSHFCSMATTCGCSMASTPFSAGALN